MLNFLKWHEQSKLQVKHDNKTTTATIYMTNLSPAFKLNDRFTTENYIVKKNLDLDAYIDQEDIIPS